MKQKVSRVYFIKTENVSVTNTPVQRGDVFCPKAFSENASKRRKADGGSHPSGLKTKTGHWRPRAAVVTGGDPWRGRGIGGYLRVHGALPRLWVVELAVGKHHVDGGLHSGGQRFGWWWILPRRAAGPKLRLGSEEWVH